MIKLNLGCGDDYKEGWVNVDLFADNVDIRHDLNCFPYPFKDGFFDVVEMNHVLEHLIDPNQVLYEVHRILKSGGVLIQRLPVGNTSCYHLRHFHGKDYFWNLESENCFRVVYQKRYLHHPSKLYFRLRNWFLNLFTDEWEYKLVKK